jgi:hypothetical protein
VIWKKSGGLPGQVKGALLLGVSHPPICPPGGAMDIYEKWNENRTRIPAGRYHIKFIAGRKNKFWLPGKKGYGKSEKITLMFEVIEGEYQGAILPMFLTTPENGKVPQGSHYYWFWSVANGNRKPIRARLKEMPISKFQDKSFMAEVVTVKPKHFSGDSKEIEIEQPEYLFYSRVDVLYELITGRPNN